MEDFLFSSQVLILPPYQRKGHGRRLLTTIYNDLRTDSRVRDITGITNCFIIIRNSFQRLYFLNGSIIDLGIISNKFEETCSIIRVIPEHHQV